MRENIHSQPPLVAPAIDHEHAAELQAISDRLDACPLAADLVLHDLCIGLKDATAGRVGLAADTVLRAALIKQMRSLPYEVLAFHLADSATYRAFCRIGFADKSPSGSALQRDIKRIRPETFERINALLLLAAVDDGIEKGRKVRVDCTVTETNVHKPADSEQLWDCVRVLTRVLQRARELINIQFTNHTRRAKRRRKAILNAKSKTARRAPYVDLLKVTRKTVEAAKRAVTALHEVNSVDPIEAVLATALAEELQHFTGLAERVIDQTHRRIVLEEKVPAQDKVLSIFEPHTDIIIKKKREVEYGHKLCLTSGASGLVTDLVIEDGNPADSELAVRMVERQADVYGRVPRQVAFDGGFASKKNLADIKAMGVKDVAFNKRRGLKVLDMVKSSWVYKQLYNFRAGIEAGISFLKRCFGLRRCTWRGLESFKAYAWLSVLTANLLTVARHDLEQQRSTTQT